jgi:hypothetical protein
VLPAPANETAAPIPAACRNRLLVCSFSVICILSLFSVVTLFFTFELEQVMIKQMYLKCKKIRFANVDVFGMIIPYQSDTKVIGFYMEKGRQTSLLVLRSELLRRVV